MTDKSNYEIINEEIDKYKDTLVLDFDKLVVLRGFMEDDMDYYYTFENLKGDYYHSSCCGGFVPLKDQLTPKNYDRLQIFFQLNLTRLAETINKEIK